MKALQPGVRLAWIAAVAALTVFTVYSARNLTHGFVSYYTASRLLIAGQLGPAAYDDAWFAEQVKAVTQSNILEIFFANPPTMSLMALPVVLLNPQSARAAWLLLSLGCAAAAALALLRLRAELGARPSIAVALLILLNPSAFANLRIGQGYLFVFSLLAVTAVLLIRKRDGLAGATLGLLIALKTSGLALLVLLAARRRWRAVLAALAVAGGLALAITPFIDPQIWIAYPAAVREYVQRPASAVTAYQTTLGFFRHLCVADPKWNPAPAADCAPVAFVVPAILLGMAMVVTIVAAVRERGQGVGWIAAGVALSELTLPAAAEPHFVLLAIPLALIEMSPAMLAIVAALLIVPLEWTAETFTTGWSSLLAYPRLYAAWLLWALSLRALLMRQRDRDRDRTATGDRG
jgi:hypothetical protein